METRMSRAIGLAAYQLTLLVGIVLFPIAVLANKVGLHLPVHRVLGLFDGVSDRSNSR